MPLNIEDIQRGKQETDVMSHEKLKGSVMVIGGGIAGIEASISLSSAGYGV